MIAWAVETMAGTTLLMLLVLAVRKPVAELFGAEWAYALWLLPFFRMVMPQLPAFMTLPVQPVAAILPSVETQAAAASTSAAGGGEWLLLLLALWAGGAAVFAMWQQSTYSAFLLHLGPEGRRAVPPVYGGIKVVESDAVDGPIALGIVNRRIVVPEDFGTRYSETEQRLALEHELVHHRRFDLVWNWVALGMLALNWFNPVAHLAFRAFRADQELSCDAAVTRRAPDLRHDYACALVKAATRPGLVAACPLNHASVLKRRLKMMQAHRGGIGRALGGFLVFAMVGTGGLALSAPGVAEPVVSQAPVIAATAAGKPVSLAAEMVASPVSCGSVASGDVACSESAAKQPELRRIAAKAAARAETPAAKPEVEQALQETELAFAETPPLTVFVASLPHEVSRKRLPVFGGPDPEVIRASVERAHAHMARLDVVAIRAQAKRVALAQVRVSLRHGPRPFAHSAVPGVTGTPPELHEHEEIPDAREIEAEIRRELARERARISL